MHVCTCACMHACMYVYRKGFCSVVTDMQFYNNGDAILEYPIRALLL